MLQLLLKIQDNNTAMTEFRENLIISSNILMWLIIVLYMIVLFFDPMSMNDDDKFSLMIFAGVSFFSLISQFWFNKVIDVIYDFFKNYEVKKKQ